MLESHFLSGIEAPGKDVQAPEGPMSPVSRSTSGGIDDKKLVTGPRSITVTEGLPDIVSPEKVSPPKPFSPEYHALRTSSMSEIPPLNNSFKSLEIGTEAGAACVKSTSSSRNEGFR